MSSHLPSLNCVYTSAYSAVLLQALIENENRRAQKWMSPMMALRRKLHSSSLDCQFVFFHSTHATFFYIDISAFKEQVGLRLYIFLVCFQFAVWPNEHNVNAQQ